MFIFGGVLQAAGNTRRPPYEGQRTERLSFRAGLVAVGCGTAGVVAWH
jgi:hypothetical protein